MEYQGVPLSGLTEEEQQIFSDAKDYESLKRHNGYLKLRAWLTNKAAHHFLALRECKSNNPKVIQTLHRKWQVFDSFMVEFDFEMDRPIEIRDRFVEDYNRMMAEEFQRQQDALHHILS